MRFTVKRQAPAELVHGGRAFAAFCAVPAVILRRRVPARFQPPGEKQPMAGDRI